MRIATTGASFGAFHAANTLFRRPDLFDGLIGMSGFYDLEPDYLKGYSDDNCYFNNPAWYLRDLSGPPLDLCATRAASSWSAAGVPTSLPARPSSCPRS